MIVKHIIAIDPGNEKTAIVKINSDNIPIFKTLAYNNDIFSVFDDIIDDQSDICVEYPQPRGQPMFTQLVDTIMWIGRFIQYIKTIWNKPIALIDRKDVKMCLCMTVRANDSMIRAAILSRYPMTGGGAIKQIGVKKQPGPLYGFKKDMWAALAVALTYREGHKIKEI